MSDSERTFLVGDIGGTNVRLALATGVGAIDAGPGACPAAVRLTAMRAYPGDRFARLEDAIGAYLQDTGAAPEAVSLSVAGPVSGGAVRLTNRDWQVTEAGIAAAAGVQRAVLINDFAAAALSLPCLPPECFVSLGGPARDPDLWSRPDLRVSALGPGTGLGHALLIGAPGGVRALDTEGGHVGFSPWDEETWRVCAAVAAAHGRCSLEHLASGPGLSNLYAALAGLQNWSARPAPETLRERADDGDVAAQRALGLFCEILGAGAGDLALAAGARDGVFVLGGVAAEMADLLRTGAFRQHFEAKGAFSHYTKAIPAELVTARHAGLIGAAAALGPEIRTVTLADD